MSLTKDLPSHQQEINNSHNGCVCLESESDQVQEIERLRKENVGFLKSKREIERKLREETQAFEKARVVWKERETELLDQLKVLHETISVLAQQNKQALERRDEENSYSAVTRELKSVQKSNKELERRNSDLTAELEKAKREANESVNTIKIHVRKIRELEDELSQTKNMNQSLMEDNKSYQRKMFEKTIKGEFKPPSQPNDSHKYTEEPTDGISENTLEAELTEPNSSLHSERVHKESDNTIVDKLQKEIKSLNDTNKEMKSYIEKILSQIIEKQGFEEILSFEKKSSPTSGSFGFNNNNNNNNYNSNSPTRKVERHKTLPSSFKTDKESYVSLPSRKSNDDALSDAQKRGLRRSSTLTRNTKRFSIFGWGGGVEEKKEDPFMKPMFLLQQEQDRKEF